MKNYTPAEIEAKIYALENSHNIRLSSMQKSLIVQNYQAFGMLPNDALFKAFKQREIDLDRDEGAKRARDSEQRLIDKKHKELIDKFPALQERNYSL